jgi:hypothetical protein
LLTGEDESNQPSHSLTRARRVFVDSIDPHPAASLVAYQTGVLEDAQVACRRRPLVSKATGDLAGRRLAAEVDRQEDLPPSRVRQRGNDGIECRQLRAGVFGQSCSTSQIVMSSSTGPIGSHTAMTSGV